MHIHSLRFSSPRVVNAPRSQRIKSTMDFIRWSKIERTPKWRGNDGKGERGTGGRAMGGREA